MAIAVRIDQHPDWTHYEGNIVGGGDVVLMAGITKSLDELFSNREFSHHHKAHIQSWQEKHFPHDVRIGHTNNTLKHLWHGELEKRNYKNRYTILSANGYDPTADLEMKANGPLAFSNGGGKIKQPIADYLMSRQDF